MLERIATAVAALLAVAVIALDVSLVVLIGLEAY
jgi:hypothetical protein